MAQAPARDSHRPGTYFIYNNWDFNAAGTVFEKLTGKGIYEAFAADLAVPLQLEDYDATLHRKHGNAHKSAHLAYPFYLSTRDMARIGQLALNLGQWQGKALVRAEWIAAMTARRTTSAEMHPARAAARGFSYGYLWWLPEVGADSPLSGAFMAWGVHGQYILVVPGRDMVIAHKRRVPEGGDRQVSWVQPFQFLKAATLLVTARCE